MNIKKYLKSVWNDLVNDESGQYVLGKTGYPTYVKPYVPPKTQAQLLAERYTKFIASPDAAQKFAASEAGKLEQLAKAPASVYKPPPPITQPPVTGGGGAGGGGAAATYNIPGFNVDLSGIWETAGMMADNEINPQLSMIDRLLQEAGYTADESQRAINEAYPIARRSLQKSIYENMVAGEQGLAAMGTGRGGGRQELLARAGEREATGLESIETQKQREVGAIQRALGQYQGQLGTQRTALAGQRGGLQASYAEQLRGARFGEAATIAGYGLNQAQLAEQARQFNASLAETQRQYNESLAGSGITAAGGQPYATTPGGTSYFLTDADLAALGLGTKVTTPKSLTTTGVGVVKKPTYANIIQAGKPKYLQSYQMQKW